MGELHNNDKKGDSIARALFGIRPMTKNQTKSKIKRDAPFGHKKRDIYHSPYGVYKNKTKQTTSRQHKNFAQRKPSDFPLYPFISSYIFYLTRLPRSLVHLTNSESGRSPRAIRRKASPGWVKISARSLVLKLHLLVLDHACR